MEPSFEKVQHAGLARDWTRLAQAGGPGVVPGAHPCRSHEVAGFAEPWPRAVSGQAVPTIQRFGTGKHGQRPPTTTQRPPADLGQPTPLGFCRKHEPHVFVAFLQDDPGVPKRIVVGECLGQVARV